MLWLVLALDRLHVLLESLNEFVNERFGGIAEGLVLRQSLVKLADQACRSRYEGSITQRRS